MLRVHSFISVMLIHMLPLLSLFHSPKTFQGEAVMAKYYLYIKETCTESDKETSASKNLKKGFLDVA